MPYAPTKFLDPRGSGFVPAARNDVQAAMLANAFKMK
jgi:hypothetical protein